MSKRFLSLITALILLVLTALPAFADGDANAVPPITDADLYIIADSNTRLLTADELWNYTYETLSYIRNEILARHGYAFHNMAFYDYFNAKPWYHAGGYPGFEDALNNIERSNHYLVRQVENAMKQKGTANTRGISIADIIANQNELGGYGNTKALGNEYGNGDGKTYPEVEAEERRKAELALMQQSAKPRYVYNTQYIIPDSNSRALTAAELWAYTRETLRFIRNEILARHGYEFGSNKYGRHFGTKDWYKAGGYADATLSGLEWQNVNLIRSIESMMDELGTQNEAGLDILVIQQNMINGNCPG